MRNLIQIAALLALAGSILMGCAGAGERADLATAYQAGGYFCALQDAALGALRAGVVPDKIKGELADAEHVAALAMVAYLDSAAKGDTNAGALAKASGRAVAGLAAVLFKLEAGGAEIAVPRDDGDGSEPPACFGGDA